MHSVDDIFKHANDGVMIVTFWNAPQPRTILGITFNNIPDGAHTVAIKYCGGMYYVYNAYNSDYFTRKMTESQLREYIGEGFFHGIGIG